jgi:hypothetical protein
MNRSIFLLRDILIGMVILSLDLSGHLEQHRMVAKYSGVQPVAEQGRGHTTPGPNKT